MTVLRDVDDLDDIPWPEASYAADPAATTRPSWEPVDLEPVLSGTWQPAQPTVGRRDDGIVGMLYPGKQHAVIAEPEHGKGWFAVATAVTEMNAGNAVVYIDFEGDEFDVGGRLLTVGALPEVITKRFTYMRPESGITAASKSLLRQILGDLRPTFAVIDGTTEAMVMHRLDPLSNADVATFGRRLPGWLAKRGPAVLSTDHLPKSVDNRGRFAIGAQHKLAGLDGAAYVLMNRQPFGIGITGRSTLMITKDRPGQLRRHAVPSGEGQHWFGDLILTSHGADFAEVSIAPPNRSDNARFRPTTLMQRISYAMTLADKPLSKQGIEDRVKGRAADIRTALACLVDEGFVIVEPGARGAQMHRLLANSDPA